MYTMKVLWKLGERKLNDIIENILAANNFMHIFG